MWIKADKSRNLYKIDPPRDKKILQNKKKSEKYKLDLDNIINQINKYNQTSDISTLNGSSLKLVNKFTFLGSSVSSTETDIDTRLAKAWKVIDRLSIIWNSDLTDKMKRSFFQATVVSILLYGCTTWTLTIRLGKKLDGNKTRMLREILNKSWR